MVRSSQVFWNIALFFQFIVYYCGRGVTWIKGDRTGVMIILAPEAILAPTCIECTLRSSSKIFGEIISGHTSTSVLTTFIIMKGKCTISIGKV